MLRRACTGLLILLFVGTVSGEPPSTAPSSSPDRGVGPADRGTIVPTGQTVRSAGDVTSFPGRPTDLCLSPDGSRVFVKNTADLTVLDARDGSHIQRLPYPSGSGSMHGIAVSGDGGKFRVYVTGAGRSLHIATSDEKGMLDWERTIDLPGPKATHKPGLVHALGIAIARDGKTAFVCLSRNNTVGIVDLQAGKLVEEIPVGVCPYEIAVSPDGATAWVSNFGGRRAAAGDKTENSAGTAVVVDGRSIAASGTITQIDLKARKPIKHVEVGLHPAQLKLTIDGKRLFVACANSDTVDVVDTAAAKVVERISVRPEAALPYGSLPNALTLSADQKTLYVANAGNNAIAVIALGDGKASSVAGFIPTGWFPGAVVIDGQRLFVANTKGSGSRAKSRLRDDWNSTQLLGSVSRVAIPDAAALAKLTEQAKHDARIRDSLQAAARADATTRIAPRPIPAKIGEPSLFRHVIYVIKENRTYDQVFGDIGKGNSEPKLCIYGRDITPNHHALAERFGLLDNYYCNGVVSADGHQWATQGMVSDYQEKGFGGNTRSYDFGTDALCYAGCDFIWDSVLLAGLSFRNYGEFDFPTLTGKAKNWYDVNKAWGTPDFAFTQSIELEVLRRFTCREYPGWEMQIPDVRRMEVFLKELADFERAGNFPNFTIVYLPQDHTQGRKEKVPSPRAHQADNDLALGRLVEAMSHSRFWKETVIFVNEDDPQDGFDHVDGHRSLCLVLSPYSKRGAVVSKFYNQSSVLHTITRIFGLPPLNQLTAAAPTMEDCFTEKPDFTPYECLPNRVPIDESNKAQAALTPRELKLMKEANDFSRPDVIDDDDLNELLWIAERPGEPYPKEWAGAHGRGLKALGLELNKK
jgi:DNA-binding beta-propeller fold protein YncE